MQLYSSLQRISFIRIIKHGLQPGRRVLLSGFERQYSFFLWCYKKGSPRHSLWQVDKITSANGERLTSKESIHFLKGWMSTADAKTMHVFQTFYLYFLGRNWHFLFFFYSCIDIRHQKYFWLEFSRQERKPSVFFLFPSSTTLIVVQVARTASFKLFHPTGIPHIQDSECPNSVGHIAFLQNTRVLYIFQGNALTLAYRVEEIRLALKTDLLNVAMQLPYLSQPWANTHFWQHSLAVFAVTK